MMEESIDISLDFETRGLFQTTILVRGYCAWSWMDFKKIKSL